MRFIYNDGGREVAGYKGRTGDCGTRAIAIATGLPYQEVYDMVNEFASRERLGKRRRKRSSARGGLYVGTMHRIMQHLNWTWTPTMVVGSGCACHLREDELPAGHLIVRLSRHYAAVIDRVLHDTYQDDRDGTRCVYGYWSRGDG